MIKHRVLNGTWMIAAVVGALFLPATGLFLIIVILAALMCWEFYGLLASAGVPNFKWMGLACVLALILGTGFQLGYGCFPMRDGSLEASILAFIVLAVLLRQCAMVNGTAPLLTIAGTFFGILYIGVVFNFYTKLLLGWPDEDGRMLLFFMILVVKVTDMGAYFTGCSLGRHKLIPRISPAKTWEGCAGGVLSGLIVSLLFWLAVDGQLGPVPFTVVDALILGLVLPVTGIVGDLIESMLKRAAVVKDSGQWVKGMGGILDILDSLLFAGPVFYLYLVCTAS